MSSSDMVSLSRPYAPETVAEANAQILVGPCLSAARTTPCCA
jgi:hypothetical protein